MKRRLISILLGIALSLSVTACSTNKGNTSKIEDSVVEQEEKTEEINGESISELKMEGAVYLQLSEEAITINGDDATTDSKAAVYVANDIVYYEEGKDFTYGEGTEEDAHSKEEAEKHTVVHITKPGTYVLSGKLDAGQIAVDLGEDAEDDAEAVVTLVLNNVDITCSVAPAVIFYNVYECSSSDEDEAVKEVDTSKAGANVLIADGTTNNINGSYVARIYRSVELNEEGTEVVDSKKLHKYDAAFYSKMSMNMNGGELSSGVLNINAENEGLDSELHLTINGGQINIVSGNDGINTNEDKVSVTTINGGVLFIKVDGSTKEGDGIDSNGWLVINGGTVVSAACSTSMDAGIDSDMGIHINSGNVVATGNMLDHIAESKQNYVVFTFQNKVKGDEKITLKKGDEEFFFTMGNDYTYLIISNEFIADGGIYTLWKGEEQLRVVETQGGMMQGGFGVGQMPEGFEPGQMPEGFEPGQRPEGGKGGNGFGQRPEGGRDGNGFGQRPEGGKGGNGFEQRNYENGVAEFEIKDGANMFMVVSNFEK